MIAWGAAYLGIATVHALMAILHGIDKRGGWAIFSVLNAGFFVFLAALYLIKD